jgi:hypothetical protein
LAGARTKSAAAGWNEAFRGFQKHGWRRRNVRPGTGSVMHLRILHGQNEPMAMVNRRHICDFCEWLREDYWCLLHRFFVMVKVHNTTPACEKWLPKLPPGIN